MFEPNPFSPGKRLTQPDVFSGRRKQLTVATQMLVQAATNNVRHALITGDRGIGKSSFSSQVQGIARGEIEYLSLVGATPQDFDYSFLVAEYIAQDGHGVPELVAGLLREIEAAKGLQRFAKYKFDFSLDLGPLQAAATRKDASPRDLVDNFIDSLQEVEKNVSGRVDGILLVIDEVDRIAGNPGVSTFFKVATEMLSARGLENVAMLPVGLVGTIDALKAEHASVGRIFRPIEVPLLSNSERIDIVRKALSTTSVEIDGAAERRIAELSGGYPNAVHQLGEQAFEIATADAKQLITTSVVDEAVRAVVSNSAREEFDSRYLALGKGRFRTIPRYMSTVDKRDVTSQEICGYLKVKQTDVSATFDSLMKADVIVRPEPGIYRIREPLFREYLRYLKDSGEEPVQRRPQKRIRQD